MKKKNLSLLFGALLMLSCTREAPVSSELRDGALVSDVALSGQIVRFTADEFTRAVAEVDATALRTSGFKVCGATYAAGASDWRTACTAYFNEAASYDAIAGSFKTATDYYYPEALRMKVFAANVDAVSFKGSAVPNGCYFDVTSPFTSDIVVSSASWDPATGSREGIALAFNHALAQVSVSAKGAVSGLSYDVKTVSVNTKQNGRFLFFDSASGTDMGWVLSGASSDYAHFSGTATCGTADYSAVGTSFAYFPGTWTVTVTYDVRSGSVVAGSYTKTFDITPVAGKRNIYRLTLPFSDSDEIVMNVSVVGWASQTYDVSL